MLLAWLLRHWEWPGVMPCYLDKTRGNGGASFDSPRVTPGIGSKELPRAALPAPFPRAGQGSLPATLFFRHSGSCYLRFLRPGRPGFGLSCGHCFAIMMAIAIPMAEEIIRAPFIGFCLWW